MCGDEEFSTHEVLILKIYRLSDEEWHGILGLNPPEPPGWITSSLPIV